MGNEGSVGTVNYSAYDGNNRLKTITYSDSPTVSFTYDNNGNRTTMTDSLGTTTYTYDALDRLSSVIDPFDKTVSYTYDPATNKKTITYPGNKAVAYEYDQLNRLWKVNDWLGYTTTYAYDNRGNLSAVSNTKGTHADYTYDIANRLKTASDTTSADTTISNFQFTLDKVGNRTNATMSIPLASAFTTKGINATYDPANQVESWDSATFGFDDAGRQTVMTDGATTNYTYNLEDRLTGINNGTDTYQYQYNGAGDRLASTANGTEKRYVLDLNGNMSRVLCETDASGNITAYYVYGLGLLYKITPTDERYHYHFDPIGSTIAITDVDETITDKYAYSPFGELMNEEVTTENPFRYVGQFGVMDEGNGLLFMRARFYDPETKRFLSRDPVKGEIRDTQILNFHQYARNNPAIYVDYKGESYSFIGDIVSFSVNVKNKDISGLVGMAAIGGITILRNVAEKAAYLSTTAAATTKLATMATAATVVGAGFVALEGGYGLAAIGEGAYHGWKSDYNPRSEELGVALGGYVAGNILGGITRGLTNLALTGQYASGDLKDAEGGLIGMNNKVAEFLSTMKTAHDVIKQSENMKSSSPAVIIKWNTIKYLSVELKVSPKTLLMGGI